MCRTAPDEFITILPWSCAARCGPGPRKTEHKGFIHENVGPDVEKARPDYRKKLTQTQRILTGARWCSAGQ